MLLKIEAATSSPVSLADARAHCRAPENGDDDALVQRALDAAIEYVERHTSLAVAAATFEHRTSRWPCDSRYIDLPKAPVRDVDKVEYVDENGALQEVSALNYDWKRTPEGARIRLNSRYSLPELTDEEDYPVRVTFVAGFDDPGASGSGDDASLKLPATLPIAILLLTEHFYEHRGVVDATQQYPLTMSADAILAQLRIYR